MNYTLHYNFLVERAKKRNCNNIDYIEKHHILPRCMGGTDEKSNLVKLTAREHFVAHQLLVKIYPNVPGLVYALVKMSAGKGYHKGRINNRLYEWIKRKNNKLKSESKRGKPWTENRRKSYELKPPIQSQEANKIRSEALLGRKTSSGMLGKSHTSETKLKISENHKGKMYDSPRNTYAWLKTPDNIEILFGPLLYECKIYNLNLDYVLHLCKNKKKSYKGWTFHRLATDEERSSKIQILKNQGIMF